MQPTHLFPLGHILITPGALAAVAAAGVQAADYVTRHVHGNWGDMSKDDWERNTQALTQGTRVFSAYVLPDATRLWIITEADRRSTTLLLPEEY